MNCTNCGNPIVGNENFCGSCGAQINRPATSAKACTNCGAELLEGHPLCVRCGASVNQAPMTPYMEEEAKSVASSALTFGILGIIFSSSFFLSLLGVIFSSIAISKAKKYKRMTGTYLGKAGVARGLGIGGLISGIVFSVIGFFYFVVIALMFGAM